VAGDGGSVNGGDEGRGATTLATVIRSVSLVALALVTWEIVAQSGVTSRILVPSLVNIAREFGQLAARSESLGEAWQSLHRALIGFSLAAIVGVGLGVLMGRSALTAACFNPVLAGTYPIPKIALFPIFIFVFGIGSLSKVLLVFLECLYPIAVTTYAGSRAVNRVFVWSALNMGASRGRVLLRVVAPATAPFIFAGLRVALPIAMIVVIITEMISSADGLGYLVTYSLASLKTDRMLAVVVAIALLGLLLDRLLVLLRDRLVFWERLESYYVG
jgi:ABC-type nitrate/sulfonate/bicarbonate transport system permease component